MPPRINELLSTTAETPPGSPLLLPCVLVGNDNPKVPFLALGSTDDENKKSTLLGSATTTTKEQLSWKIYEARQDHQQLLYQVQKKHHQDHGTVVTTTALFDASLFSLQETAVTLLDHAFRLVESMGHQQAGDGHSTQLSSSSSSSTVTTNLCMGQIRATLAVRWALQYLDSVRRALEQYSSNPTELDAKLQHMLREINHENNDESLLSKKRLFRISPWRLSSSQLVLDVNVGKTACWSDQARLSLSIDPIWQVKAGDLQRDENDSIHRFISSCSVTILKVTHRGNNGEALVRVGLSPGTKTAMVVTNGGTPKTTKKKIVWSQEHHTTVALQRRVRVQEARLIETNANPPTTKMNVDLYESSMYGDNESTVTFLVKTHPTRHDGTCPHVHMELVVAFE